MLTSRARPLVCSRCFAGHAKASVTFGRRQFRRLKHSQPALEHERGPFLHYNNPENDGDLETASGPTSLPNASAKAPAKLSIREELLAWQANEATLEVTQRPPDATLSTTVSNILTRAEAPLWALDEDGGDKYGGTTLNIGQDDVDGFFGTNDRQAGDLVELSNASSRTGSLAVYLGYFSGRHHFYTNDSKWLMSSGYPVQFSVPNFATAEELNSIYRGIPQGLSVEDYQQMQNLNKGPSRHDGAVLLERMQAFRLESERIHQSNISSLDAARDKLADDTEVKHLSLFEITDILLPKARGQDMSFPASALYSVLTALRREDIAFRALKPSGDSQRHDFIFEIIPKAQVESIKRAVDAVREYNTLITKHKGKLPLNLIGSCAIGNFVLKSQEVVRQSRRNRGWTTHGTLKPSKGFWLNSIARSRSIDDITNFLEWWSRHDLFNHSSRYHSYGSTILRALNLYDGALLDQRTAWTFLQELGIVDSREIPSRNKTRLPGTTFVTGGGLKRADLSVAMVQDSQRPDIAADARCDTAKGPVYCIDDPSTVVIDDGISLERTGKSDEFWIHVHVADPASRILPNSELSKWLEIIPSTIYLPGHYQPMLPDTLHESEEQSDSRSIVETYSLRSGAPALTFSTKVNAAGEILDYTIKPTQLAEVVYMAPGDVSDFVGDKPPVKVPNDKLSVGGPYESKTYGEQRTIVSAQDLDESEKDDLRILHKLGESLREQRLARGAWPVFPPGPSVSVTFDSEETAPTLREGPYSNRTETRPAYIPADPQIDVKYESGHGCSIVANSMVLAGQIAARWASDRGLPMPYRRDMASSAKFDEALAYVNTHVYPLLNQGIEVTREHRGYLTALIGGVELSTTPGPYFILGLDMYTKVTSPLRRYGDLLAHWQIHAALAHERATGQKLKPEEALEVLPLAEQDLKRSLVLLQMREKMIRDISQGSRDWILIALTRAWLAADGSVPKTMRFTVTTRGTAGFLGELDYFDLPAEMDAVNIDGKVLIKDVSVGDQLEVQIEDINVYTRVISVKALEYLGRTEQSPPSPLYKPLNPLGAMEKGFGINVKGHATDSPALA